MGKQLLILRHGKSDWSVDSDDFNRPLKKRGVNAAQKIGYWLAHNRAAKPDLIISSPAVRALETAKITAEMAGLPQPTVDERVYEANLQALLNVIAEIPETVQRPLIVGHNPGLEELLMHLANIPRHFYKDWKLLTTGTLAIVKIQTPWNELAEQGGKFKTLLRGRDL